MELQKKHSTLKVVFITLGILAVLAILLGGALFYWFYRTTNSFNMNDKPVIMASVDQFIADINQGKFNDAAALADQKYISIDGINSSLADIQPVFKGYEKQDANFSYENIKQFADGKQVTYTTTVYFSDSTKGSVDVVAAQEGGVWKLQGVHVNASPSHINGDIMEYGDQVESSLQNKIINAYETQKAIYSSGDLTAIRKHMILASPLQTNQITNMSDADIKKVIADQVRAIDIVSTSTDVFRSHDAVWKFNKDRTSVLIKLNITITWTNGRVGNIGEQGSYSNGQWYF